MTWRRSPLPTLAICLLASIGCGGHDHGDEGEHGHGHESGDAAQHGDPTTDCTTLPFDTYVAGIEKLGDQGRVRVAIVEATPAPPDEGDNVWIVRVTDADSGEPVQGATITSDPTMPEHGGHGTDLPEVEAMGEDGRYTVRALSLAMSGLWEVPIEVALPDGTADRVIFRFCVRG